MSIPNISKHIFPLRRSKTPGRAPKSCFLDENRSRLWPQFSHFKESGSYMV